VNQNPEARDRAARDGLTAAIWIREARREDIPLLFSLITELAEYERAADDVTGTEELLHEALFGPSPSAEAVIAELDGAPVGFALFFATFSTWLCRSGLWLEDLYVSPRHRRAGVGAALLEHVAQVAVDRGCGRVEWSALHWNTPALDFYDKLGAERMHEWLTFRLSGHALERVAGGPDPGR
jgi:GNAT superfamily N-acetyltransferase